MWSQTSLLEFTLVWENRNVSDTLWFFRVMGRLVLNHALPQLGPLFLRTITPTTFSSPRTMRSHRLNPERIHTLTSRVQGVNSREGG
jgi:hypothetical protein